jgi:hypothetical protein
MISNPTLHLRFIERIEIIDSNPETGVSTGRTVKILQQFHEHNNGKDVAGDMFVQIYGTWRDIRTEREGT